MSPIMLAIMAPPPSGIPSGAEHILRHFGVVALFALVFLQDCGIPTLVPGSLLVLAGGYFVYAGYYNLHVAALTIALAAFLGASLFFFVARRGGRPLVLYLGKFVGLTEKQFDGAARLLERWGPPMLLVTRVAPGTRVYMTAFAGISGWTYRRFALWTGVFVLIWAYGFVLLGRALGPQWDEIAPTIVLYSNRFLMIISVALIAVVGYYVYRARRAVPSPMANAVTLPRPRQAATLPRAHDAATPPSSSKEQSRAYSDSGGGRLLRVADSPPSRQGRTRRRRR